MEPGWIGIIAIGCFIGVFAILNIVEKGSID